HRLQQVPSFIAQIRRIQKVLHPPSLLIPLGQILSTHPKNDYSDTLLNAILDFSWQAHLPLAYPYLAWRMRKL
ncbi:MAG TPA: hypothetical protein VH595_15750, partial [Verrucomicrobiae bacterium]|nr:hypothetical protein [Verrucomicrobiae bacterium]